MTSFKVFSTLSSTFAIFILYVISIGISRTSALHPFVEVQMWYYHSYWIQIRTENLFLRNQLKLHIVYTLHWRLLIRLLSVKHGGRRRTFSGFSASKFYAVEHWYVYCSLFFKTPRPRATKEKVRTILKTHLYFLPFCK